MRIETIKKLITLPINIILQLLKDQIFPRPFSMMVALFIYDDLKFYSTILRKRRTFWSFQGNGFDW